MPSPSVIISICSSSSPPWFSVTQGEVPFRNFAQVELQTQGLENLVERWRFLAFRSKINSQKPEQRFHVELNVLSQTTQGTRTWSRRRNLTNICRLDSCTISASYEVSEVCYCPARRKVLAPLQRNTMHSCRIQLTLMSSKSTRECPADADAWKRTTGWTLSGIWEVEARPFSHTIALFHTSFHLPLATWRYHCESRFTDLWDVIPTGLALCDLGARGWGEPWFPHNAVLLFCLTNLVWRVFSFVSLVALLFSPYQS